MTKTCLIGHLSTLAVIIMSHLAFHKAIYIEICENVEICESAVEICDHVDMLVTLLTGAA